MLSEGRAYGCCFFVNSTVLPGTPKLITVIVLKNGTLLLYNVVISQRDADRMSNSVDPDQTAPKEQSDLGLHSLLRVICTGNFYSEDGWTG